MAMGQNPVPPVNIPITIGHKATVSFFGLCGFYCGLGPETRSCQISRALVHLVFPSTNLKRVSFSSKKSPILDGGGVQSADAQGLHPLARLRCKWKSVHRNQFPLGVPSKQKRRPHV